MSAVFEPSIQHHTKKNMFFGESVDLQRYDTMKYPAFDKFTEHQLGFFWRPEEVDVSKDAIEFRELLPHEKFIFTQNLKSQIMLDSIQGRGPNLALLPIVSLPELETWIETWSFSETIHSRSYTHILRNVYEDPSVVFDDITGNDEIMKRADAISKYYDDLIDAVDLWKNGVITNYEVKSKLWLCLNAINALEGIRFYVSFACSWAFAENNKMMGNSDIITLICRDENLHLASTQKMLKLLPQDDKDYAKIREEFAGEVEEMFLEVAAQEKEWATYLFKDGSIIGLNADILHKYVDHITGKRMKAVGYKYANNVHTNPLPWTMARIKSSAVQAAPQEKDITSYVVGGIDNNVDLEELQSIFDEVL